MDALAGLLDGPRARDAFLLRAVLDPPWSIRIEDEAPLAFVAVARGQAWVHADGADPSPLAPGSALVARGPEPYTLSSDPALVPRVVVHPGQHCRTPEGEDLAEAMSLGLRTWGNRVDGSTELLIGTYERSSVVSERLLSALPPLLVLGADDWSSPLPALLEQEITRDDQGQSVVLDRLLDLLVIAALRTWFARPEAAAPGWYRAQGDPVVGSALGLMHDDPARSWTIATLAAEVGVSRAQLARRFNELVGEPPIRYLAGWRLALAADLMCEPGASLGSVAQAVGYGSPFALSAAFTRVRGMSPQEHRRAAPAG